MTWLEDVLTLGSDLAPLLRWRWHW